MPNTKGFALFLFILLAIIWGSSFILMKRALLALTPYQVGALRVVSAGVAVNLFAFRRYRKFPKKDFWPLFWVGMLGNALPYMLFPLAVSKVDSATVGITNSLVPIFTMIIGMIWFKSTIKTLQAVGVVVGFAGAWSLISARGGTGLDLQSYYLLFAVLGTVFYAISINTIKERLFHVDSLSLTAFTLAIVSVPLMVYLAVSDFPERVAQNPQAWASVGYIVFLGVLGTGLAVYLFNHLIKISSTVFSASVTYCIPIVAVLWGWWDGEQLTLQHLTGIVGILIGVYLVNRKRTSKPAAPVVKH